MLRLASVACIVAIAGSTGFADQNRPNFSGRWSLVEEHRTLSSNGPSETLGKDIAVEQSATVVTIRKTLRLIPIQAQGGQPRPAEPIESILSNPYTVDGAEHDSSLTSTYRASWTAGQLVIVTQHKSPANKGAIHLVIRLAFSLEPDGRLVVESLRLPMIPRMDGTVQMPPVAVRSVYKKVQ